jgi:hypothetical protein
LTRRRRQGPSPTEGAGTKEVAARVRRDLREWRWRGATQRGVRRQGGRRRHGGQHGVLVCGKGRRGGFEAAVEGLGVGGAVERAVAVRCWRRGAGALRGGGGITTGKRRYRSLPTALRLPWGDGNREAAAPLSGALSGALASGASGGGRGAVVWEVALTEDTAAGRGWGAPGGGQGAGAETRHHPWGAWCGRCR